MDIITIPEEICTPELIAALKREYKHKIPTANQDGCINFFPFLIEEWRRNDFIIDLEVYKALYPYVRPETACLNFDNYKTTTSEREKLVSLAKTMASNRYDFMSRGLFVSGSSLEERTHIELAVIKEVTKEARVIPAIYHKNQITKSAELEQLFKKFPTFLIFLDMYSLTEYQKKFLQHVIELAHSFSTNIFISSRESYTEFLNDLLGDLPNGTKSKFEDRLRIMFDSIDLNSNRETDVPKVKQNMNVAYNIARSSILTDALQKEYSAYGWLNVIQKKDGGSETYVIDHFPPEIRRRIELDIFFFKQNSHIPSENICSQFDNYHPKNKTQQDLLETAKAITQCNATNFKRGLYMCGSPGVGKTHLSISIAKELMKQNQTSFFVPPIDNYTEEELMRLAKSIILSKYSGLIIDDFNTFNPLVERTLVQLFHHLHMSKGILSISSNRTINEILQPGNILKQLIESYCTIVEVSGNSYRQCRT